MTYVFIPDQGVEADPKFEGTAWKLETLEDRPYMEGGQFMIAVEQNLIDYKALSLHPNRKGIFVCTTHKDV